MIDSKFLRSMAERLRRLKLTLDPAGASATREAVAELEAMARDFKRWADEVEGKPKENGQGRLSS